MIKSIITALLSLMTITGCAGYIGGDLRNIEPRENIPECSRSPTKYVLNFHTDADNDYGENWSAKITALSMGILPTYALSFKESRVYVADIENVIYSRTDKIRIHKFYGITWAPFLIPTINMLNADAAYGMRVYSGIKSRAIRKTLDELAGEIDIQELCLR